MKNNLVAVGNTLNTAKHSTTRTRSCSGILSASARLLLLLSTCSVGCAQTVTFSGLLSEMTDREAVARFPQPTYECLQASSYNRASTNRTQPNQDVTGWFADSDGFGFIRTEQVKGRTEWVIMEHEGPGCLTKFWTPFFYYDLNEHKGPNIRIYLDGATEPVLDESLIELVTGKGSVKSPFSMPTARAGDNYLPIPFARSCKITMAAKPFYYIINYRAYAKNTQVEALTRAAIAAADLEKAGKALQEAPEPDRGTIHESATVNAGGNLEVKLPAGPGAVRQFTVRLREAATRPAALRSTVLTMNFDGQETVWCPLGDFFCSADTVHPIQTWQRTVTADGTMVCRWVMPYRQAGILRVLNLGTEPVEVALRAEVTPWSWDDRSLLFHAHWRPDDVVAGTPFQDWNYIDIQGQGVFVGDAWTVLNPQGSWWGEGDEKIYVDGAMDKGFPTHFGTGTEDYYGWAGGEVPTRKDEFSVPFLANARVGGLDGRTTAFNICTRARSLDAIPFTQRLVFDMESSFGTDIRNPWNLLGYSAVTFWYAKPGATHNRPPRPAEAARAILSVGELQAKAASIQQLMRRNEAEPAIVLTESREFPIRRGQGLSMGSLAQKQAAKPAFKGEARPGEFFVFQLGVYALKQTKALAVAFEDLKGPDSTIPASALRCLSLGGTNYLGRAFEKQLTLKPGDLQALWVGVAVPTTAKGTFTSTAQVKLADNKTIPVNITLQVEGTPVADQGDSTAKNLSRLRWLDSTVGSEPTLTKPFTPVQVAGRKISILGRELELAENGLPARIESHFSPANTRIEAAAREVLARPATFIVETSTEPVSWKTAFGSLSCTDLQATWTATNTTDGLRAEVSGRLDYTGSGEVHVRLCAERDFETKDARLEVPFREDAARYFMGLHHQGGRRPESVHWRWDIAKRQDCFWLGDVNAGLMLRFKDAEYLRPPVNIYYAFRPLLLPKSWGNDGRGGVDVEPGGDQSILAKAYSGPRSLKKGEALDFIFELYLTPFRTLDTEKQWATRFTHLGGTKQAVDDAVATADPQRGPSVVNVHHASFYSPYINYPYSDDSFPAFCELVKRAHDKGVRLRVYYTTREITQNMPELFPLHSLNGEIILPGPARDARTLLHPKGPHAWLTENLRQDFVPAWEAQVGPPYADMDLSVITTPDSRWNNFYLEGLRWLVEKSDFDGMYIDDTALDATSLQRARRILDARTGRLIDLHTWNHFNNWAGFANNLTIYMEILPYLDRLWLGEGFDANTAAPDFWLVEMSGLPFGLMSEMLDGANAWRGMVFGETGRLPWSGDPRGLWKVWDEFGIQGTEFLPFYLSNCPVQTGRPDVLATVYRKNGRSLIALGSWATEDTQVNLQINWKALGLVPERTALYAPPIPGMQAERLWRPGDPIPVEKGRGWFLVLDEQPRQVAAPATAPEAKH